MTNVIMSYCFPMHDIVCSLLDKPFSTWNKNDQIDIVKTGRPQVRLSAYKRKANNKGKSKWLIRSLQSLYARYEWTCGSTYFQNFHCWPCLLFAKESERWKCDVYFDDGNADMFEHHARQESHIASVFKLDEFKSSFQAIPLCEKEITIYDFRNLNRKCLQLSVEAIIFMIQKQIPLVKEDDSSPCSYSDLFHLLLSQSQNKELQNHFRKMKVCENPILAAPMLPAVVESVSESILEYIRISVKAAEFFSLRIDDGLNESSECALFIRIVKLNNKLKEFFIGCYSLGSNENSLSLLTILDRVLEKYEYKSKLIGISYDITCVKFNYLKELRVGMKLIAQQSTNVNLLGHCLDYTVQKCLRRIPACGQFFAILNSLLNHTKNILKRDYCPNSEDWREVCNMKNSCCSKFKLLSFMLQDWTVMLNLFQEIQKETFESEDPHCILSGTSRKLKDRQFIFLAVFLRQLFEMTNTLHKELIDNPFNPEYCQERVKHVCVTLYTNRNDKYYEDIYKQADQILRECSGSDADACYKPLFYDILDNVIMELHTRFENTDQHTYFEIGNLFHCQADEEFVTEKVIIARNYFPNIFIEPDELLSEIMKILKARIFENVPLLNAISGMKIVRRRSFAHAYRLMTLITLQTPSTQQFRCLHEFSSYLKDSDIGLRPHLSNILMNEDILNEFSYSLNDVVLSKLSAKYDAIRLSLMEKNSKKQSETILGSEPSLDLRSESNLLMRNMRNPTTLISSIPGLSPGKESDSFMTERDVTLAETSEAYPADEPQPDSLTKIKEKLIDPDTYKQVILSVMQELGPSSTRNPHGSLFQPPVLIKEEPVTVEEEL